MHGLLLALLLLLLLLLLHLRRHPQARVAPTALRARVHQ
jgi:hypothetical protein